MEQILEEIQELANQLAKIEKKLEEYELARSFDEWIPRKKLMEFLDYGDTQMAALLKNGELIVSEIGIRKFIKKDSVIRILEKNLRKV